MSKEFRVQFNVARMAVEIYCIDRANGTCLVGNVDGSFTSIEFSENQVLPGAWMVLDCDIAEGLAKAFAVEYNLKELDSRRELDAVKYHLEDMRKLALKRSKK